MSSRSDALERYTRTAIAMHWLIAAVVIAEIAWGWWMQEIPKQPPGQRADAFNFHKSLGLMILLLMIARLSWRLAHPPPPLPPMPAWNGWLAHANHGVMYVALFVLSIGGYLGSAWSGFPVKFFGLVLPSWTAAAPALKDLASSVHLMTSWLLLVRARRSQRAAPADAAVAASAGASGDPRTAGRYLALRRGFDQTRGLFLPILARDVERGLAAIVPEARLRTGGEKRLDRHGVPIAGGPHQGR